MTRYAPLWQQAGNYPAQLDRGLIAALWPNGGVLGGAVTATTNTMQVSVAPGSAAVTMQSGQGSELCHWDAPEAGPSLVLAASPPSGQSRVDLVVVQVRDAGVDGGANNDFVIQAIAGTPAASNPATPATPANALPLATVTVPGAAANLNGATITPVTVNPLSVPAAPVPDLIANPAGRIFPNGPTGPFPAAALTPVNLNSVDFLRGGFTTTGFSLVVPVTGIYNVAWSAVFNASGGASIPATYLNVMLTRNGSQVREASGSPTSSVPSVGQSDAVNLNAGDRLSMSVQVGAGGIYCAAINNATFVSASLVSQ